jgi:hypothetical protein
MRKYSMIDLLRFKTFADENQEMKPMELIKGYNQKFPELIAEQQLNNLFLATGIDLIQSSEKKTQLEIRRSGKPLYFIERMDTNEWWKPLKSRKKTNITSFDTWTSNPNTCHAFEKKEDAETRMDWIIEEHGMELQVTEHVFDNLPTKASNETGDRSI